MPKARPDRLTQAKGKDLIEEAQDLFGDAQAALTPRLPKFLESMAFYRGNQWPGSWSDDIDERVAMETRNYIRPAVRSATASMLQNRLNPEVIAANGDTLSLARADASGRLARSFLRNGVFPYRNHLRAKMAANIYGGAWLASIWKPDKGRVVNTPVLRPSAEDPSQMEHETDDWGDVVHDSSFEGDIDVQYGSPINVCPDPHATDPAELRYVCRWKACAIGHLDDLFHEDAFGKSTEDRWGLEPGLMGWVDAARTENDGALAAPFSPFSGSHSSDNDLAHLVELWERPSMRYPRGRLVVYCGDVLIAAGSLPYRFPWTLVTGMNVLPGSLYADGVVDDLKSPQRAINMAESKKREWIQQVLSPALMVPATAGIDRDRFSDLAGEVILYNPGNLPTWMNVPPPPDALFREQQAQEAAISSISTQSDVARGQPPPSVSSGRAIAYLYEFQKGMHAPDDELAREEVKDVLQNCLYLARDFYDDGRMLRILGKNNRWQGQVFKREDFDFESDLIVEPRSGAPNSRALRQSEIMEYHNAGLFEDTPAAQRARRMLELDADDSSTVDPYEAHRSRAEKEAALFSADPESSPLQVLPQDHDLVHLEHHDLFRVSDEFLDIPPELRARFDQHCEEHETQDAQKKSVFAAQSQQLTGSTGQGSSGGAPPPKAKGMPSPMDGGHPMSGEDPAVTAQDDAMGGPSQ